MRGKAKSPEAKFKEKKARVDAYVMDTWLKMLRQDPELVKRIAEQRHGAEVAMAYGRQDGEYNSESPDLLEVLRQAREAKELLKDELGESKGSAIKDIAEIVKCLPSVLQTLGQINPAQIQRMTQGAATEPRYHAQERISERVRHEQLRQPEPVDFSEVRLEVLMGLLELEPADAWVRLQAEGEVGWQNYLKQTNFEQLEASLKAAGEGNAEAQPHIEAFLREKRHWLQQLLGIAKSK